MSLPTSTTELIHALEQYSDVVSWINDTLDTFEDDPYLAQPVTELTVLEQHITHLVSTLDIACEDTSTQLEHIIDDVSRSVPRLTYDLHFMKDGASTLQTSLLKVHQQSKEAVSHATGAALDHLQHLDTIKTRMEGTREVLREAENWSTLELEVTSLLAERNYAKAAERLSEASRSMVVFQNTPDYDPRRTLMVNLQNQLEASLSSALVSAINTQDMAICRSYFSIFSHIQRESEFRNYYNASRRSSIINMWQSVHLVDCDMAPSTDNSSTQTFADFLPKFYASFSTLLNLERTSIPSIFPDPALTLSTFISSTLSALQPTFPQRLSSLSVHYGDSALSELLTAFRATEDFAASVSKILEKMKISTAVSPPIDISTGAEDAPASPRSHVRRRSSRMSISWRAGPHRSPSGGLVAIKSKMMEGFEWDQELFQPFLDFQLDYGSLERRLLTHDLREIVTSNKRERDLDLDRARLLRESAVDIFGVAETSLSRCTAFTYGYGSVGLVQALDDFFQSFIDAWTTDVQSASSTPKFSPAQGSISEEDLSDLDYSAQDWSDFQLSLRLLASARTVFDRICLFEAKLRSNLAQTAMLFRMAHADPVNFVITPSVGESQLLEQSSLNSAELNTLLASMESETYLRDTITPASSTVNLRHAPTGSTDPLLANARAGVFAFAKTCQTSLQGTILSPLRKHLGSYASSSLWVTAGDPKAKRTVTSNDLQVPNFSLSPSDTVQRVAEGLLNLPRLFEVYADDDALSFSLHTLPHVDFDLLKGLSEPPASSVDAPTKQTHMRRATLTSVKSTAIDPEAVSSAWLASLGYNLLEYLTTDILPTIPTLSMAGAAQLASDLEYLSNIVRVLNVEFEDLEQWRVYASMDDDDGKRKLADKDLADAILQKVARMRGW